MVIMPENYLSRLADHHRHMLCVESAISDRVIEDRQPISLTNERIRTNSSLLTRSGFRDYQIGPGLLLPIWGVDGSRVGFQLRRDNPRRGRNDRIVKYETPYGWSARLDVPKSSLPYIGDPRRRLWITEGIKKTDALASCGEVVVGLVGVWMWRGTNEYGGKTALADWHSVALNGRDVVIAFDMDLYDKIGVQRAAEALASFLSSKGAHVHFATWGRNSQEAA